MSSESSLVLDLSQTPHKKLFTFNSLNYEARIKHSYIKINKIIKIIKIINIPKYWLPI